MSAALSSYARGHCDTSKSPISTRPSCEMHEQHGRSFSFSDATNVSKIGACASGAGTGNSEAPAPHVHRCELEMLNHPRTPHR